MCLCDKLNILLKNYVILNFPTANLYELEIYELAWKTTFILRIYHKSVRKNDFCGADIKILHDRSEN